MPWILTEQWQVRLMDVPTRPMPTEDFPPTSISVIRTATLGSRPMRRVGEPLSQMGARINGRKGGNFAPLAVQGQQAETFARLVRGLHVARTHPVLQHFLPQPQVSLGVRRARFGGISTDVRVPVAAVLAVYSRENGRGMVFNEDDEDDPGPPPVEDGPGKRPSLKVVK